MNLSSRRVRQIYDIAITKLRRAMVANGVTLEEMKFYLKIKDEARAKQEESVC